MNLSKAKDYIILALVIVNLVLIFSIVKDSNLKDNSFTRESINNLYTLLSRKHISLDFKLDSRNYTNSPALIKYYDFKDEFYENLKEKYKDSIKVIDSNYVEINEKRKIETKEELLEFGKKFIKENFPKDKYDLKESLKEGDLLMAEFEEIIFGFPVEDSNIKFIVSSNNQVTITILKIKNVKKEKQNLKLISSAKAISKLYPFLDENIVLTEIKRVYHCEKEENYENLDSVRVMPYYRVKDNKEHFYYVMAWER